MNKRSKHELKRLVETAIREVGRLADRGVWFCVDELEASGQPIERIRVWATLNFLQSGSPFDSDDPDLWVWPLRDQTAEWLSREIGLEQTIQLEWAGINGVVHAGVEFSGGNGHRV